MKRFFHSLLGVVGLAAPAAQAATLLLTGGIVHTVSGPVLTNAPVLIRDTRIAGVGEAAGTTADTTIDLKGQHLFPGLIAPTTVLGLLEIDGVRAKIGRAHV